LLSFNEISRQLPSKPHVFKDDWIDDDIMYSAVKVVYDGWHLHVKRAMECFVVFVKKAY